MANKTLTAANSIITISIADLVPSPVQLQGFAADAIYDTEAIEQAQTSMGVDGKLSAGLVLMETPWNVHLQADSDSNQLFDTWIAQQKQQREVYFANGSIVLPSLKTAITLTKGVLTRAPMMPNAAKTMQPRAYTIVWESVTPAGI
ncbi:MAG TPA: hypothetical protein VF453_06570 [Burkholderiaceae bacterium]